MNFKQATILTSIVLLSLLTILFLYSRSAEHLNYKYRSFSRVWGNQSILKTRVFELQAPYYFAGNTSSNLYLGNFHSPSNLLLLNLDLTTSEKVKIKVDDSLKYRSIKITIDDPYFYMADGVIPFIYRGELKNMIAKPFMKDRTFFIDAIPLSQNSFALWSMIQGSFSLSKKTISPSQMEVFPNLLEEQIDGTLENTGMLHYDKVYNRLVYLYYYRNQYIVLDTNLNLLQKGNTIDTISRAKIKVASISSGRKKVMKAPPLVVNKHSYLSEKYLYVSSNILAKNEDIERFENSSVIDLYDIEKRRYQYSFYIPSYNDKKMRDFKILDDSLLFILYDRAIVRYNLLLNKTDLK